MALFNKLFSSNKRKLAKPSIQHTTPSRFPFNKEQVRVLLFRECDWRGRRLLFDSSAFEPISHHQSSTNSNNANQHVFKPPLKGDKVHQQQHFIEYVDGVPFKYGRPSADYNNLGEMIFGSVAMSFRGTSFKVHWLQQPTRIMCSQVFLAPVQPYSSSSSSNTTNSSSNHTHTSSTYNSDPLGCNASDISSLDTNSLNSFSCVSDSVHSMQSNQNLLGAPRPIPMPIDVVPTQVSLDNDDIKFCSQSIGDSSGYYSAGDPWTRQPYPYSSARSSLASIYSDLDQQRRMSVDSSSISEFPCEFGRLNRRIMKNISTSFENISEIRENVTSIIENNYYTVTGASNFGGMSDGCVSKYRRNSESVDTKRKAISGDAISSASSHNRSSRRPRLGVAICITLTECVEEEMLCFCSEHMALLESMLYRLRAGCENAYISRPQFLQIMLKSWHTTSYWVRDLFTAPRLLNPIWLSLSTGTVKNPTVLATSFMNDLCSLLSTADTKDTNFFVSTLITAVLTHHLGWVGTVAPLITSNVRDNIYKSNKINPLMVQLLEKENLKLSEISKTYPYNALWAQLGDLYGAIASPIKISKTVICGNETSVQTIDRLLNILTYFVRCNEIKKNTCKSVFDKNLVNKTVNEQMSRKPYQKPSFLCPESSITLSSKGSSRKSGSSGLTRTSTTVRDLSLLADEIEKETDEIEETKQSEISDEPETYELLLKILKKNVMNDIPKVLAFRDSRFVKQELRIGNKSMDTGIEMNLRDKMFLKKYQKDVILSAEQIKLTVTRPDNEGVEEAIELDDDFKTDENFISLSKMITANYLGGNRDINKLLWREALNLEQIKHLERIAAKQQQEQQQLLKQQENLKDGVVFVLGDDEKLVGLKSNTSSQSLKEFEVRLESSGSGAIKKLNTCKHKYKKHSGVKFNFEQYPQIVTNYMKSKNLEYSELEVLEKGLKLERELRENQGASTSKENPCKDLSNETLRESEEEEIENEEECECCKNGGAHYLQTPSNASELEFSSESDYLSPSSSKTEKFFTDANNNFCNLRQLSQSLATLDENSALESENVLSDVKMIEVPMPENIEAQNGEEEFKSGFVPSLFSATSDHYIADMVLQGITAHSAKWEAALRQDLTISSHCAALEQQQAENIAIIANVDKHDVRLLSSHSSMLSTSPGGTIVGMSQLVAGMLEAVQVMWSSGMSPYQCMSFMESKLKEMYLQSETLAAFLLETEFCTISTLTKLLDLSVNDIPLLLSIASIHSPQVTKKYGISFR